MLLDLEWTLLQLICSLLIQYCRGKIFLPHELTMSTYPSILQTTSYNFSSTDTTPETCVGVVKAPGTFPKNSAQHASDLEMLSSKDELKHLFINNIYVYWKSQAN